MDNFRQEAPGYSKRSNNSEIIMIDSDNDKENDIQFSPDRIKKNVETHKKLMKANQEKQAYNPLTSIENINDVIF